MRRIVCQCCNTKYRNEPVSWIVFERVLICESCRLAAIQFLREICDLSLARPHPFLDELSQVDSPRKIRLTPLTHPK